MNKEEIINLVMETLGSDYVIVEGDTYSEILDKCIQIGQINKKPVVILQESNLSTHVRECRQNINTDEQIALKRLGHIARHLIILTCK